MDFPRIAGASLVFVFLTVVLEHGVAASIGGVSLHDLHDAAPVATFYAHDSLRAIYWACAGFLMSLVAFAVAVRPYLARFGDSLPADLAFAFLLAEVPLLLAHYGLDLALVDLATHGGEVAILAVYATWNGVYHGVVEWLELGWVLAIAWAGWRGAFPRWLTAWTAVSGLGLAFNLFARLVGLPEGALLPTYAVFSLWMIAAAAFLLRGGRQP